MVHPKLLEKLRFVAREFELCHHAVTFPGWPLGRNLRGSSIVLAAHAIAADDLDENGASQVSLHDLGCLVRYVADALEA